MFDNWPSHTDELSRKTLNQLSEWSDKYEKNEITNHEFFLIINVLYDTTSGLVTREVSTLLARVHADIAKNETAHS